MTRDEAIHALIEIAKGFVITVDGEWGCGHNYNEALTLVTEAKPKCGISSQRITDCYMHDEAVRIAALIAALTPKETPNASAFGPSPADSLSIRGSQEAEDVQV